MLAGSSPRQSVAMNMREALAGWKSWVDEGRPELSVDKWKAFEKAGRPKGAEWKNENWFVDNFTLPGTKAQNVIKALNNEPLWPDLSKNANFKVPSFDNNLKGWLNHSTNDGWMALFAGVDPTTLARLELPPTVGCHQSRCRSPWMDYCRSPSRYLVVHSISY